MLSSYNKVRTGKAMDLAGRHPSLLVPVLARCRCHHRSVASPHRRGHLGAGNPDASPGSSCQTRLWSPAFRGRAFFSAAMVAVTWSRLPPDLPTAVTWPRPSTGLPVAEVNLMTSGASDGVGMVAGPPRCCLPSERLRGWARAQRGRYRGLSIRAPSSNQNPMP